MHIAIHNYKMLANIASYIIIVALNNGQTQYMGASHWTPTKQM